MDDPITNPWSRDPDGPDRGDLLLAALVFTIALSLLLAEALGLLPLQAEGCAYLGDCVDHLHEP